MARVDVTREGEFKHVVTGSSESEKTTAAVNQKLDEKLPVEEETNDTELLGTDPINVSQKTLTYEVQEEVQQRKTDEIKLIWKNPVAPGTSNSKTAKGSAVKAFFTPASSDLRKSETEQVLDLPVVKDETSNDADLTNKVLKRKKTSLQTNLKFSSAARKMVVPKSVSQTALLKNKPLVKQQHQNKDHTEKEEDKQEVISGKQNPEHHSNKEDDLIRKEQNQSGKVDETIPKENQSATQPRDDQPEVTKDTISTDDVTGETCEDKDQEENNSDLPDPKKIIIKPLDLSGYAEKLIEKEEEPTNVLQPDVVADIKRDLAEKGIIVLPPSLISPPPEDSTPDNLIPDDQIQVPLDNNSDEEKLKETERESDLLEDDISDHNNEQSSDLAAEKSDRREGFKTNKSFEIRRLQAKAERLKEEKRRALFGTRYSKLKARSDHLSRTNELPTKLALKSVLKPPTPPDSEANTRNFIDSNPLTSKSKSMVRIREPEYDYQEYTDVELESDSGDSLRPISALSFSEPSVDTGMGDFSDDSLSTNPGDNSYRNFPSSDDEEYSLKEEDIHQLYDEIDNLSPSRVGFNYDVITRKEIKSRDSRRERIESGTSRATIRSTLQLPTTDTFYPQLQHTPYMKSYNEKPMPLFDALRHEQQLRSSEGPRQKSRDSTRMLRFDEDVGHTKNHKLSVIKRNSAKAEREDYYPPRSRSRNHQRHHNKHRPCSELLHQASSEIYGHPGLTTTNTSVVSGPTVYPIVVGLDGALYTHKEWKKQVKKFFETSYGDNKNKSTVNKSLNLESSIQQKTQTPAGLCGKRRVGARCGKVCKILDCSKKSFLSHLLWIALPTMFCTVTLLVALFYATGVLPVNELSLNTTTEP